MNRPWLFLSRAGETFLELFLKLETSPSLSADSFGSFAGGGGEHKERQISAHFSAQR